MVNSNYTLGHGMHAVNESWFAYGDVSLDSVIPAMVSFVKSLSIFPTRITNIIFSIICAVGILANILLLVYLIYYKRYKSPVFCVILSMGVADLGVCFGSLLNFSLVTPFIRGPLWLCQVTTAVQLASYVASNYHIAVFAVLRFIQLVYPLSSRAKVTTTLMRNVCLTIWSINSTTAFVGAYSHGPVNISNIKATPIHACLGIGLNVLFLFVTILWTGVPFVITSGFHVAKQIRVLFSRSATVTSSDGRVQNVRKQTDSRALAFTIVAYLVTICPLIIQSLRVFVFNVTDSPIETYLVKVFFQIAFTNSAINPWIYLFAAESVRSDVKKMFRYNR